MLICIYIGEAITLRHVRNGVELPPIDQNLFYDFDYQITNHISPREVLRVSSNNYIISIIRILQAPIIIICIRICCSYTLDAHLY